MYAPAIIMTMVRLVKRQFVEITWKTISGICLLAFLAIPAAVKAADPPFKLPETSKLARLKSAAIYTNKGTIYLELFPREAPWHVANFKYLADKGFYQNLHFNHHEDGYIIQGGAPGPKINSGPGYTLPPEFSSRKHLAGTLTMVRSPDMINRTRKSHGSQFWVLLKNAPHFDGHFTSFGRVIKGLNIARKLVKGDTIKNIKVFVATN